MDRLDPASVGLDGTDLLEPGQQAAGFDAMVNGLESFGALGMIRSGVVKQETQIVQIAGSLHIRPMSPRSSRTVKRELLKPSLLVTE
jgi:hypothetical protein